MSEQELQMAAEVADALVLLTRMGYDMATAMRRIKQNALDMGLSEEAADTLCIWVIRNLKEELE